MGTQPIWIDMQVKTVDKNVINSYTGVTMTLKIQSVASSPLARALTAPEFARLAAVPPKAQWFANLNSVQTKRAYQNDLRAFMAFKGVN